MAAKLWPNSYDLFILHNVHYTKFRRLNKKARMPFNPIVLSVATLYAFGEPPCGFNDSWHGWKFQRDTLIHLSIQSGIIRLRLAT